ncbi:MAG: cytidine deaminase [Flavobacteriales bacterium]|nr:cytidine deaminase [Flavobacteriales bacterium]
MEIRKNSIIRYVEYGSPTDIPEILSLSQMSREKAYAPYSRFKVGAAVKLDNGVSLPGNNQENAAYPSGLCAERVALFHAGAVYPDAHVLELAISIQANGELRNLDDLVSPCGACLQVIAETERRQNRAIRILIGGEKGYYIAEGVEQFLPFRFNARI